ncbi:MAG: terpene cyclase/mutase family protein, partial [Pirellula sp.]|nr:terpene cyclase/mutase family protein [Pirellula sp.]
MTAPNQIALMLTVAVFATCWLPTKSDGGDPVDKPQRVRELYQSRTEKAVEKGLGWLQSRQVSQTDANAINKPGLKGSFRDEFAMGNTGVTALSVMAFLAQGHVPGQGPYGETMNHGIDYLLSQQLENGLLVSVDPVGRRSELMYSHSIVTLMLAEVSGMLDSERQKMVDRVLARALLVLLQSQKVPKPAMHAGGWRYAPGSIDSDLSLTGWSIMALRAARQNGAAIPDEHIGDAIEYILKCRRGDGAFGYMPGSAPGSPSMTGLAILCLELCGEHGHEAIEPAADFLLNHQPNPQDHHRYFTLYYCSQAMFQLGDQY